MVFHITPVPLWSFLNHESQKESYLDVTEMYILLFFIVNIYCKYFKINKQQNYRNCIFFHSFLFSSWQSNMCVHLQHLYFSLRSLKRLFQSLCQTIPKQVIGQKTNAIPYLDSLFTLTKINQLNGYMFKRKKRQSLKKLRE